MFYKKNNDIEYKAYQHLSHMIMEYPGYRIA